MTTMTIIHAHPAVGVLLFVVLLALCAVVYICDKNHEENERELRRKRPLI